MTIEDGSSKNFCNKGFEDKVLDMSSFVFMVKHWQKRWIKMMNHFSRKIREEGA